MFQYNLNISYLQTAEDNWTMTMISRGHSFPQQIFPNSAGLFAKFRSSPQQTFHI